MPTETNAPALPTDSHPNPSAEFRKLPAVDALLQAPEIAPLAAEFGVQPLTTAIRAELDTARAAIRAGQKAPPTDAWLGRIRQRLAKNSRPSLRPVVNATGVIIHTNLGRAPLSPAAQAAIAHLADAYSTLEYDLTAGARGSRHSHPRQLLTELTGAQDALVVNNNAAAVFLVLAALCHSQEVIVSRGELVEIGGGFRIPDVLRQSGATLVEVGTTNRTHPTDFAQAITPQTAALMRIHASNFKQIGFITKPELAELVAIAAAHPSPESGSRPLVIDDLGSGTLLDTAPFGLAPEPTVQASVQAGADVITFSGDKLLGGPQAGLIVGKSQWIERLRRHPLARALRVDKMTLAGLDATLRAYQRGRALEEIPVWQMISQSVDTLEQRCRQIQQRLTAEGLLPSAETVVRIPGESTIGGGSLPGETLPTVLLALDVPRPDATAAALRQADPPVICRIQNDRLLFDLRTVLPQQEDALLAGLGQCLSSI